MGKWLIIFVSIGILVFCFVVKQWLGKCNVLMAVVGIIVLLIIGCCKKSSGTMVEEQKQQQDLILTEASKETYYKSVKRIWERPIFVHRNLHPCPECGRILIVETKSKIVNSKSIEAERFDFSIGDNILSGNVKFIWDEFRCNTCNKEYSVRDIVKCERIRIKKLKEARKK